MYVFHPAWLTFHDWDSEHHNLGRQPDSLLPRSTLRQMLSRRTYIEKLYLTLVWNK